MNTFPENQLRHVAGVSLDYSIIAEIICCWLKLTVQSSLQPAHLTYIVLSYLKSMKSVKDFVSYCDIDDGVIQKLFLLDKVFSLFRHAATGHNFPMIIYGKVLLCVVNCYH